MGDYYYCLIILQGSEVHQDINSDPGLFIGEDSFSSVEYSGILYVNTKQDDDYVGLVFNYQSNRRFMLVSWKQSTQTYLDRDNGLVAKAGIQIKTVKSNTDPGVRMMNALWYTGNTKKQVIINNSKSIRLVYDIR